MSIVATFETKMWKHRFAPMSPVLQSNRCSQISTESVALTMEQLATWLDCSELRWNVLSLLRCNRYAFGWTKTMLRQFCNGLYHIWFLDVFHLFDLINTASVLWHSCRYAIHLLVFYSCINGCSCPVEQ